MRATDADSFYHTVSYAPLNKGGLLGNHSQSLGLTALGTELHAKNASTSRKHTSNAEPKTGASIKPLVDEE